MEQNSGRSYDNSDFITKPSYTQMMGSLTEGGYTPSLPKYKRDLDLEGLCSSPIFVTARAKLTASGGGRGGLGTDGWDHYIYGDQPPPSDDAETRARIGRREALRGERTDREGGALRATGATAETAEAVKGLKGKLTKEEIRAGVKLEGAFRKVAKAKAGAAIKAKAVALVAKKGERLAAEGGAKAAKMAAKASAPAEEREARAARNADLAARVEAFQAAKATKGKAKAVGAFTANAIKNVMKKEAEREVAEEAKAKGTFTSPAKAKVAASPAPALLKGVEGVAATPVNVAELQAVISSAKGYKNIAIVEGRKGRYGQGYSPAIVRGGRAIPYNSADITPEELGTLVEKFTTLRDMGVGTKEKQTITNFLRVIRKEKEKRSKAGAMRGGGAASGGGGGGDSEGEGEAEEGEA